MWSENEMIEYLKKNLKPKRFMHSIGVRDTAVKLAQRYGADVNNARIAGLLHDCAKNLDDEKLLSIAKKAGIKIDDVYKVQPQLLHGIVGAVIVEEKMNVHNEEILNSIRYHTTGKQNMSLLEKIIFISDYIEPSRMFDWAEELRRIAFERLDEALIKSFDITLQHVINKGQLIHIDTINARNYLLLDINS